MNTKDTPASPEKSEKLSTVVAEIRAKGGPTAMTPEMRRELRRAMINATLMQSRLAARRRNKTVNKALATVDC